MVGVVRVMMMRVLRVRGRRVHHSRRRAVEVRRDLSGENFEALRGVWSGFKGALQLVCRLNLNLAGLNLLNPTPPRWADVKEQLKPSSAFFWSSYSEERERVFTYCSSVEMLKQKLQDCPHEKCTTVCTALSILIYLKRSDDYIYTCGRGYEHPRSHCMECVE